MAPWDGYWMEDLLKREALFLCSISSGGWKLIILLHCCCSQEWVSASRFHFARAKSVGSCSHSHCLVFFHPLMSIHPQKVKEGSHNRAHTVHKHAHVLVNTSLLLPSISTSFLLAVLCLVWQPDICLPLSTQPCMLCCQCLLALESQKDIWHQKCMS